MAHFIVLSMLIFGFSQQERIPIPEEEAPYTSADIVTDQTTGDKIICDQILVVFEDKITRSEQLGVLLQISGKIAGGVPELNIYQITFPNPKRSLTVQQNIIKKLNKNPKIVHVSARKEKTQQIEQIEIEMKQPERKGQIEMVPQERIVVEDIDEIGLILEKNRASLATCRRKKSTKHGEILFRLTINPAGEMKEVKVLKSSIKDDLLINCLEYKIRQWKDLPANGKFDRQVEFTFQF